MDKGNLLQRIGTSTGRGESATGTGEAHGAGREGRQGAERGGGSLPLHRPSSLSRHHDDEDDMGQTATRSRATAADSSGGGGGGEGVNANGRGAGGGEVDVSLVAAVAHDSSVCLCVCLSVWLAVSASLPLSALSPPPSLCSQTPLAPLPPFFLTVAWLAGQVLSTSSGANTLANGSAPSRKASRGQEKRGGGGTAGGGADEEDGERGTSGGGRGAGGGGAGDARALQALINDDKTADYYHSKG